MILPTTATALSTAWVVLFQERNDLCLSQGVKATVIWNTCIAIS
jgi:hypothetical protein